CIHHRSHVSSYHSIRPLLLYLCPPLPPKSTLFPYTTLFRSNNQHTLALIESTEVCWFVFLAIYLIIQLIDLYVQNFWSVIKRRRSEEHTSELQSRFDLVCRLLLENKKSYT